MKQAWLKNVDWPTVVDLNAQLCSGRSALHKPTSDGYEETKIFWETKQMQELTLAEAVEVCRRCHRMAPFCNFNGNTFVAIIRDVLSLVPRATPPQIALLRSLAGHMVAGTATSEEFIEFNKLLAKVDSSTPS